jgi:hypothetical protein
MLGAVSFAAELVGALPMGMLTDIVAPRILMVAGGVLGGVAICMMGLTEMIPLFFLSRGLEGLGASASVPSTLAYLTDLTEGSNKLRSRVMSYFELTLFDACLQPGEIDSARLHVRSRHHWSRFRRSHRCIVRSAAWREGCGHRRESDWWRLHLDGMRTE